MLGAFFVGSCFTTFPAGLLAEWYGGTFTTAVALIVSTAMTALTPIMADWSIWAVYINRFVLGLAGGIFFPAMHNGKFRLFPKKIEKSVLLKNQF